MKSLSWFRLYSEAVDDSKLRLLAFEDRWHFVALLCCKAKGLLDGEDADLRTRKVCVTLGLDERELGEVSRRLAAVGLIERETYQPLAWDFRQFRSDHDPTAANRQKKWRENKRLNTVTDMSRVTLRTSNGRVTASETETETETETEQKQRQTRAKTKTRAPSAPCDVSPQVWADWNALRKAKRAAVTDTAVTGIRREAEKIGMRLEDALQMCCERGWTGFKGEWVTAARPAGGIEERNRAAAERMKQMLRDNERTIDG